MAVPMVIVLGFVCTFYIYVAIRWWHVAMLARGEGRRASEMVRFSAGAQDECEGVGAVTDGKRRGDNIGMKLAEHGNRNVIVMTRARVGKYEKRVVA